MKILSRVLSAGILSIVFLATRPGMCQRQAKASAPCTNVEPMSNHPLAALPQEVQSSLRGAVRAQLRAIINDSAMGVSENEPDEVALNALEVSRSANGNTLYVVSWNDKTFGANGFNWIVEDTPKGTSLLMTARAAELASGFGVEVVSSGHDDYPTLVIASKGYAQGGGPEGQAACFQRKSRLYESTPCPEKCRRNLNRPSMPE